jgi:hypothetical protein
MASSPDRSRSPLRKRQWWVVFALFVGASALDLLGLSTIPSACIVAVAAVWGSILLATEPPVVRRVPNLRGAIVLTGVVTALGLSFYVVNSLQLGGHAHAMESPATSP